MKKLSISLTELRVNALLALAYVMVSKAKLSSAIAIRTSPFLLRLEESFERAYNSINKQTFSSLTPLVELKDSVRDKCYLSLKYFVFALLYSPSKEIAEAAQTIYSIVERHGPSVERLSYMEESVIIRKLLADLKEPSVAGEVSRINLPFIIDALETAQGEFEEVYEARNQELVAINDMISVTNQRKELEADIRNFLSMANTSAAFDADWAELLRIWAPDFAAIKRSMKRPDDEEKELLKELDLPFE